MYRGKTSRKFCEQWRGGQNWRKKKTATARPIQTFVATAIDQFEYLKYFRLESFCCLACADDNNEDAGRGDWTPYSTYRLRQQHECVADSMENFISFFFFPFLQPFVAISGLWGAQRRKRWGHRRVHTRKEQKYIEFIPYYYSFVSWSIAMKASSIEVCMCFTKPVAKNHQSHFSVEYTIHILCRDERFSWAGGQLWRQMTYFRLQKG